MIGLASGPGNVRWQTLPDELRDERQWVTWAYRPRPAGKPAKVPLSPVTGKSASPTDPRTWGRLGSALTMCQERQLAGVGFVFSPDDPYTGIDLDVCRDPDTGRLDPWAAETVARFNTYTEVSPSGTGVKLILRARLP